MGSFSISALVWSIGVQLGIVFLIASFYLTLTRSVRLEQVRFWAMAWTCETIAIAAAFLLVVVARLEPSAWGRLFLVLYAGGKVAYVLLLFIGTYLHFRSRLPGWYETSRLLAVVATWGLALGLLAPTPVSVLPFQWLAVSSVLLAAGVWALRNSPRERSRELAWVLVCEGVFFLVYVPITAPELWGGEPLTSVLNYSSLLDAGLDLLLGLAMLMALEESRSAHLERVNRQLQASHERLRRLVDLDPLTGLANRRGLRKYLKQADQLRATVIFLDIDNFKHVNDRYGHAAGDACLIHLASTLTQVFRPDDGLFRWGGDEFLVVAPGLDEEAARERMEVVRRALRDSDAECPPYRISIGTASLRGTTEVDEALRSADQEMYLEKRSRSGHARTPAR